MSRSERVASQLGMSHGAAAGRLRKLVMFDLLKRLKENICFKCKEEIATADDISIEHKEPWENRDASLFWNLDNIAFSHLRCNKAHRQGHWWKTPEEKRRHSQDRKNKWERDHYTSEKRHQRYEETGH